MICLATTENNSMQKPAEQNVDEEEGEEELEEEEEEDNGLTRFMTILSRLTKVHDTNFTSYFLWQF